MKHTNKKGFTIVELVIVIAVIAILAAVLIPTFSNLIKKANESSDVQAVRQMNTILAAEGAVEKNNIFDVFDALHESNLDAKDYKPLVKGTYFFWDDKADCIVYTDADYNVIFPKDYDKANKGNWFSLTQTIEAKAPAKENYTAGNSVTAKVSTGAELLYVLNDIKEGKATNVTITIPATGIDMMGASFGIADLTTSLIISCEQDLTDDDIETAVISNAIAVDTSYQGDGTEGNNGIYAAGLFGNVSSKLTIENVTFKNIHVKNTSASGIAILVGINTGTVTLNNVTIEDSTVIGHRNVGALVGNITGKLNIIGKVDLQNVDVMTVGGRSGLLVGYGNSPAAQLGTLKTATILVDADCSYSVYKCDQNPEYQGGEGSFSSTYYNGTEWITYSEPLYFIKNSLCAAKGNATSNSYFPTISGWT